MGAEEGPLLLRGFELDEAFEGLDRLRDFLELDSALHEGFEGFNIIRMGIQMLFQGFFLVGF